MYGGILGIINDLGEIIAALAGSSEAYRVDVPDPQDNETEQYHFSGTTGSFNVRNGSVMMSDAVISN